MRLFSQSTACALIALANVATAATSTAYDYRYKGDMICKNVKHCATYGYGYETCETTEEWCLPQSRIMVSSDPCTSNHRSRCIKKCIPVAMSCTGGGANCQIDETECWYENLNWYWMVQFFRLLVISPNFDMNSMFFSLNLKTLNLINSYHSFYLYYMHDNL